MKRILIVAMMSMALTSEGQGLKLSAMPVYLGADTGSYVVGVQNAGGAFTNKRYAVVGPVDSMDVATESVDGNVTGRMYWQRNYVANTLHIWTNNLNANQAHNFSASPYALFYAMGILPSGSRPKHKVYFTTYFFGAQLFKDDSGVQYLKQFTSVVDTDGTLYINFIKSEVSVSAYSVVFNCVIPLE